jgi:hypothetical protein
VWKKEDISEEVHSLQSNKYANHPNELAGGANEQEVLDNEDDETYLSSGTYVEDTGFLKASASDLDELVTAEFPCSVVTECVKAALSRTVCQTERSSFSLYLSLWMVSGSQFCDCVGMIPALSFSVCSRNTHPLSLSCASPVSWVRTCSQRNTPIEHNRQKTSSSLCGTGHQASAHCGDCTTQIWSGENKVCEDSIVTGRKSSSQKSHCFTHNDQTAQEMTQDERAHASPVSR